MTNVSVIIPTYNRGHLIGRAIDSVLGQTYRDFEIIVIDDGSTDNTKDLLLDRYANKIRYISQQNRGVSAARNRGIREACGEFIAFLDSDDAWLSFKLAEQVEILDNNPDVSLVFSDAELLEGVERRRYSLARTENKDVISNFQKTVLELQFNDGSYFKEDLFEELLDHNLMLTPTVLLRKKILEKTKYFNEELLLAEDYDLWIRVARETPLAFLNRVTATIRIMGDGLSSGSYRARIRYYEWEGKVFEGQLRVVPGEYRSKIRRKIIQTYNMVAWGYLSDINLAKVRKFSLNSLRYNIFQIKILGYLILSFLPKQLVFFLKKYARH